MLESFNSESFTMTAWLALFPLTYLVHISEEYWCGGGYSNYLMTNYCVELSPEHFVRLQALGVFLMTLGVIAGLILRFPLTMVAILSAIVLGNALVHTIRSIQGWTYTPGLVTAVVLWLPLGSVSLLAVWPFISSGKFTLALAVGFVTNCVVELITTRRNVIS
jgi:hypothetical protein